MPDPHNAPAPFQPRPRETEPLPNAPGWVSNPREVQERSRQAEEIGRRMGGGK